MMADEKPQKDEGKQQPAEKVAFADRHRSLLVVAVVGVLMLVEGVGLVVVIKGLSGGPQTAEAEEMATSVPRDELGNPLPSEIHVSDLMAYNDKSGRVAVYQMSVYAEVDPLGSKKIKDALEIRQHTIDDRFSRIIRASDPKYLDEPGLETIRRQFKYELDQILGDETLIKEILFPEFSKSRAD